MQETFSAASQWEKLRDTSRLDVQRRMSFCTIPSVQSDPARQTNGNQDVVADFQSVGAMLVNSLANKLAQSLFPVGRPSFRVVLTDDLQQQAQQAGSSQEELQTGLAKLETEASKRVFLRDGMSTLTQVLKYLIITGQCLLYRDPVSHKMSTWSSEHFVTRRDPLGNLKMIILKQQFMLKDLPDDRLEALRQARAGMYSDDKSKVDLYTVIQNAGTQWTVDEYIDDISVMEQSTYPAFLCPWQLPTWQVTPGDHYARGYVEMYAGDFARLSMLSESLTTYQLEALSVLHVVDESAGGVIDEYMQSGNGDFVSGKVGAISTYESGDYNKMAGIQQAVAEITQRLSQAFGYTGQARDSERTTATEVQQVAQEADRLLGGSYSTLAYTLQTPLMYLCLYEVGQDLLMGIISEDIKPEILTGTAALGRASDSQNLLEAAQMVGTIVPSLVQASSNLDPNKIVSLLLRNSGVDVDSITKSAEQLQQEAQAQEQAANAQQQLTQQAIDPTNVTQAAQQITG